MAPDARLIKTVENPLGTEHEDVISSYAVEAEMDGEVDWVFVYRDEDETPCLARWATRASGRTTSRCGSMTSRRTLENRRSLSERLVHFAGDGSERLVAGAGAVIVDQTDDVVLPNWQTAPGHARSPR